MKTVTKSKSHKVQRSGAGDKSVTRSRVLFPQARFLTRNDRLAINSFKKQLFTEFPGQIERIILYGSKARGNASSGSDIDLLVVTRSLPGSGASAREISDGEAFGGALFGTMSRYGVDLSALVRDAAELETWTPLYDHIRQDGVELWRKSGASRSPWRVWGEDEVSTKRSEHVQVRMDLAQGKLDEAQTLLAGGFYNSTISTAYYAMFYASKAILLALGEDPHKHTGVVSLFGDKIVRVGLSDGKYGHFLGNAKKLREDADYNDFFRATQEQAQEAIRLAQDFVQEAREILKRIEATTKTDK